MRKERRSPKRRRGATTERRSGANSRKPLGHERGYYVLRRRLGVVRLARYRRQRWATSCGIARRVHLWVGYALEELVKRQPAVFDLKAGDGKIERVEVRRATCGMYDQVGDDRLRPAVRGYMRNEAIARLPYLLHRRARANLDAARVREAASTASENTSSMFEVDVR
jgi:hypothetical protein